MDGCFFKPEELISVFQTNAVLQRLSKTTEVRSDVNVCFAPNCSLYCKVDDLAGHRLGEIIAFREGLHRVFFR